MCISTCRQKEPAISNHVSMPCEKEKSVKQDLWYQHPEMKKETPVREALRWYRNENAKKPPCVGKENR